VGTELWNLETGNVDVLVSAFNQDGARPSGATFSKDGRFLAVSEDGEGVTIWDLPSRREQCQISVTGSSSVPLLEFAVDGRTIVTLVETVTDQDLSAGRYNPSALSGMASRE
jgi:WD40 repeat protein